MGLTVCIPVWRPVLKTYLGTFMTTNTKSIADNDNDPICAYQFPDLASRRAYVASIRDEAQPVLAWPTFERLAHLCDPTKLGALMRWRDMTTPSRYIAANDNTAPQGEDMRREIRPSIPEMLIAAGTSSLEFGRGEKKHLAKMGGLVFNFDPARRRQPGLLTEWGTTAKGKSLKPVDRPRAPKGKAQTKRSHAAVASYLARQTAIPSPLTAQPYARPMRGDRGAGMYAPLPREKPSATNKAGRYGVAEARAELIALGVDGNVRFADLPFMATKCPDFILHGPQWKGGVSAVKGAGGEGFTTTGDSGHHATAIELARMADGERLRKALGEHAAVLDMAVTDSTAEEIGIASGYAPSTARKYGARLIDDAIEKYLAIAA